MKMKNLLRKVFVFILCLSVAQAWFWSSDEGSESVTEEAAEKKDASDDEIKTEPGEAKQMSQEQLNILNREEFERRLTETLKAHETHYLNTDSHLEPGEDHDLEFDHQAFLGDEAEQFKSLTAEESKERLSKIAQKIDVDNDTLIDLEELTRWIKDTQARSVLR